MRLRHRVLRDLPGSWFSFGVHTGPGIGLQAHLRLGTVTYYLGLR